ncbi:uncharacterized protein LOC110712674 [Chenopodium quinoa]|uniref:uncharacterized protein LOC110712674 n=1 Tax=Chenopodium quinoa TaxID=63459 RepID=UPI000B7911FB|nr:uncharacterized protein LOC110712674 [Chenopodium quinoa]XP_021746837.1 uncharacterized protein LOC110712674 [Chenopodium quinoa]
MYFRGPWCNWSMVPPEARALWWNAFKKKFSWDPSVAKDVKKGWETKCKRRLTGVISTMCTRKNYSATWCAPSIKLHIMKLREKDEFKEKSKQCSLNKKNPEKEMPLHCKGSKSSVKLRIDLEQKLKRKVTVAEVYREAHVNKKQKFVDKTSENVWANFEKKKADNLEVPD